MHIFMGVMLLTGNFVQEGQPPPPAFMGWFIIIAATCLIVVGMLLSLLILLAGLRLKARRSYTFCYVVAAIECVCIPFGTILGIFTMMILGRPAVKEAFEVSRRE